MTHEERYLFDLQGFLVIRSALSPSLVARLQHAVETMEDLNDAEAAARGAARQYTSNDIYAQVGAPSSGNLRDYVSPALGFGEPCEELIDCPSVLEYIDEFVGGTVRLDAATFMSRGGQGAFRFHHGHAELLPYCEYSFTQNEFQCVSVKIAYALTDVSLNDGCFAVISGSHKSNFTNPLVGQIPDPDHPLVTSIPCVSGDAILFTEDLSHGAVENHSGKLRRTLFYSYAPAFQCRWNHFVEPAAGFDERATPRRRELTYGTQSFVE